MDILDTENGLELVGGEYELYNSLLNEFIDGKKFEKSVLLDYYSSGKMDECAAYVHYFKGAARQICGQKVAAVGQKLEDVFRGKAEGDVLQLTEEFDFCNGELNQYIFNYLKEQDLS